MTKKMLIDATHDEETRVAVVDGNRLAEFDYESKFRKPLKGSIFLAKVTRVEPSLQAAFVNFGGNRHGFLPFSEIHPDYFRIPIADREALIAEQEAAMAEDEAEDEEEMQAEAQHAAAGGTEAPSDGPEDVSGEEPGVIEEIGGNEGGASDAPVAEEAAEEHAQDEQAEEAADHHADHADHDHDHAGHDHDESEEDAQPFTREPHPDEDFAGDEVNGNVPGAGGEDLEPGELSGLGGEDRTDRGGRGGRGRRGGRNRQRRGGGGDNRGERGDNRGERGGSAQHRSRRTEKYGGDEQQGGEGRGRFSLRRKYKIQEVIKRGQIMLVQVSKEERGNKGAAVSSYLSLPGRYCVLMPNSPRGGGVSRKISNYQDRAKMRDIMKDLEVPKGMSVIVRTAGVSRTKPEVKRDLDYLMRLWDNIRELTLQSSAPSIVYEEANLIKRAVRDLYGRDVDEIHVSGEEGYKQARDFMKMMIPSHVKKVIQYKDDVPLFTRYKVEGQIAEIGEPQVTLPSGGYLVINPTEALISIDVNSGKSTKERHIEETATRTNLEAAEEVARQLRMRDLGGLIVIDFIDMEDRRNNAKVERKMRESLAGDRARIQMGRISSFGLMELSRQRLNPSLTESQYETCTRCTGLGRVRTADATSILVLRAIEDEGIKRRAAQVIVHVSNTVALYILNNKRKHMTDLEARYNFAVLIRVDDSVGVSGFRIEVGRPSSVAGDDDRAVPTADDDAGGAEGEDNDSDNDGSRESGGGERPRQQGRGEGRGGGEGGDRDREGRGGRRRGRRGGRNRRGGRREEGQQNDGRHNNTGGTPAVAGAGHSGGDDGDSDGGDGDHHPGQRQHQRHDRNAAGQGDYATSASNDDHVREQAFEPAPQQQQQAEPVLAAEPPRAQSPQRQPRPQTQQAEPRVKDYEKINETSGEKKKGWWNRLGGE